MGARLELHPLCTFFPRMEGPDFEALKADIKANSLRQRIVTYKGMILDGGNRYRACIETGTPFHTLEYNGSDPVGYVLSANLHRRHLSPGQSAAIVSSAVNWAEAQRGGRPKNRDAKSLNANDLEQKPRQLAGFSTSAKRAVLSGASQRTQERADAVAKADPSLAKAVAHGDISLHKAVEQVNGKHAKALEKPPAIHGEVSPEDGAEDPARLLDELNATIAKQQVQIDALSTTDQAKELLKQIDMRKDAERELGVKMDMVATRDKELKSWANWFQKVGKLTKLEKRSDVLAWIEARL